jgi:hypothetical protein
MAESTIGFFIFKEPSEIHQSLANFPHLLRLHMSVNTPFTALEPDRIYIRSPLGLMFKSGVEKSNQLPDHIRHNLW